MFQNIFNKLFIYYPGGLLFHKIHLSLIIIIFFVSKILESTINL